MRAVIQRVKYANVKVEKKIISEIGHGILLFVAIGKGDNEKDFEYISNKLFNLRIFEDEKSLFNRSLIDVKGELLIVSQFTLYGDCRKGRRPSFDQAEKVEQSRILYKRFVDFIKSENKNITIKEGVFQAYMEVNIVNDGPVTFILDSRKIL
jgi:D-tyrosyl-tRNA(Tyr) deacylase